MKSLKIIVEQIAPNAYSAKVIPKGKTERLNKQNLVWYSDVNFHYVIMEPIISHGDEALRIGCSDVLHDLKEVQECLEKRTYKHVCNLWEYYRTNAHLTLEDRTEKKLFKNFREPIDV